MSNKKRAWEEVGWIRGESIGAGGHGRVYEAHRHNDKACDGALKILHVDNDRDRRLRLRNEVSALARLRHPGIAELLSHNTDACDEETELFLITRLIEGVKLSEKIKCEGRLNFRDAVNFIGKLLNTLQFCHQRQIIHRDIKPDNIIVKHDGEPILIDFGISYDLSDVSLNELTGDEQALGAAFLRLPELDVSDSDKKDRRDVRSDVCLMAGIFFFVLTGREPRQLEDGARRKPHRRPEALAIFENSIADPSQLSLLMSFFDRAFEVEPSERYQSALELHSEIGTVHDGHSKERKNRLKSKTIPTLGESSDQSNIEIRVSTSHERIGANIVVFNVDLHLTNLTDKPIRNYQATLSVPRDIINGSPSGEAPGVQMGDFRSFIYPIRGQIATALEPARETLVNSIQCKLSPEALTLKAIRGRSRSFQVELFRKGEKMDEAMFSFEELGMLDLLDLAK